MNTKFRSVLALVFMSSAALANPAYAQTEPPAPPAEEPDLDELLGLKKPGDTPPTVTDTTRTELDRQLKPEDLSDEFQQAVVLMGESAQRLTEAHDTGLDTQRLQADALARLDKIIDDAQKNSSKSKKKQKQQQQQQDSQAQQNQQQSSQSTPSPTNQAGTPNVARQDGTTNPPRAADSASWGNLPEHLRQALTQGNSDRFSSLYQQLTEQYYRRLAEEPRDAGRPR